MREELQEFRGRTILVTGAGKGIGRATAKLLASRGASILALIRTAGDLDSLEAETLPFRRCRSFRIAYLWRFEREPPSAVCVDFVVVDAVPANKSAEGF
jgi:NAD(P)-dependent dehydrogenase (short-subunit alcohol dehydrogenase family)